MKRTEYFTKKEQEIIKLLKYGYRNIDIGKYLDCSPNTIKKYISNMMIKTNSKNRVQLVYKLYKMGFYNNA